MAEICGVICPQTGPRKEPVACAFEPGHEGDHSWAGLPTWEAVVEAWRVFDQEQLDRLLLGPESRAERGRG